MYVHDVQDRDSHLCHYQPHLLNYTFNWGNKRQGLGVTEEATRFSSDCLQLINICWATTIMAHARCKSIEDMSLSAEAYYLWRERNSHNYQIPCRVGEALLSLHCSSISSAQPASIPPLIRCWSLKNTLAARFLFSISFRRTHPEKYSKGKAWCSCDKTVCVTSWIYKEGMP